MPGPANDFAVSAILGRGSERGLSCVLWSRVFSLGLLLGLLFFGQVLSSSLRYVLLLPPSLPRSLPPPLLHLLARPLALSVLHSGSSSDRVHSFCSQWLICCFHFHFEKQYFYRHLKLFQNRPENRQPLLVVHLFFWIPISSYVLHQEAAWLLAQI